MTTTEDAAFARALALPFWTAPENLRLLGGGKTNLNVALEDGGESFVVRLGEDIPEHGILRFNELAISRAAHAAGVAPAVRFAAPGALVLDYVPAHPVTDADLRDPETLDAVVDLVARVHRDVPKHLRGPILSFWVFHILRDYDATLHERGSPWAPLLPDLLAEARMLEAMVGPVEIVMGHNDLLPANILRGAGRFWLIDWEYAGFNTPLFDLGGLATNNGLTPEAEMRMLTAYFGAPPGAALWRSYAAMKCASLLRETMWSMVSEITSALDVDFAAYTETNLAAYRAAWADLQSL